jgi:hypothetical protein
MTIRGRQSQDVVPPFPNATVKDWDENRFKETSQSATLCVDKIAGRGNGPERYGR